MVMEEHFHLEMKKRPTQKKIVEPQIAYSLFTFCSDKTEREKRKERQQTCKAEQKQKQNYPLAAMHHVSLNLACLANPLLSFCLYFSMHTPM